MVKSKKRESNFKKKGVEHEEGCNRLKAVVLECRDQELSQREKSQDKRESNILV